MFLCVCFLVVCYIYWSYKQCLCYIVSLGENTPGQPCWKAIGNTLLCGFVIILRCISFPATHYNNVSVDKVYRV